MLFVCSWCDKKKKKYLIYYASVTSHSRAPYGLFPGYSRAVLNKNRTSTHGAHTGPVRRRTNFASPHGARRVLMHALLAYGPRTGLEIVSSPWTARAGTVRGPPNTTPVWDFCPFWVCQFPYVSIRAPYGTLAGHARAPYGARHGRICENIEDSRAGPVRCPYGHRTGYPWCLANYSTKQPYRAVSSRTGP